MFFDNYQLHNNARVRPSLLWEYELDNFDWQAMRTIVLQRVIERGRLNDFYAVLNIYGLDGFKEGLKNIACLNAKDIAFICTLFGLKKQELLCCKPKPLHRKRWHS